MYTFTMYEDFICRLKDGYLPKKHYSLELVK